MDASARRQQRKLARAGFARAKTICALAVPDRVMTAPAPETLEREKDKLYVTDA
jgi:hypothetical protein